MSRPTRGPGPRTNVSPANIAAWLLAIAILALVIPTNDKIAANTVFFAAHGVSPLAWAVVLVVGLVVFWAVLAGVLWVLRRVLTPVAFDVVASTLTLVLVWFLVANALAVTVFAQQSTVAWVVGLAVAIGLTALSRRLAMGTVLVVFAAVATAVPLVSTLWTGSQAAQPSAYSFDTAIRPPNVVWVVADELSYPAAFDADGNVRPGLPNLARLASGATVYANAYAPANFTDYAVPAMLTGQVDLSTMSRDDVQRMRSSLGVVGGLASTYGVVVESPVFSYDCDDTRCASVGARPSITERIGRFLADTAAVAGRTALAPPFADAFPTTDGRWSDFWAGGEEFGNDPEADTVANVVRGIDQVRHANPDAPFLALWHTIRTHAPWVLDGEGRQLYPARVPVVDGAHLIGEEADETYTSDELKALERRLWFASVQDFDRQLGVLLDHLEQTGQFEDTMVVVVADHGAAMTEHADRRVGDDQEQRWSQIAHVPLIVKAAGQHDPQVVTAVRSTGQIAATVLAAAGATPAAADPIADGLADAVAGGPVFTDVKNGAMTGWHLPADFTPADPWHADDFAATDPRYRFAVGVDPRLLGEPLPSEQPTLADVTVHALPGESDLQVLIVDRPSAACAGADRVGLVADRGAVVGSVLWEGARGSGDGGVTTRGWSIVPRASSLDDLTFTCTVPPAA